VITTTVAELVNELSDVTNQLNVALAACRSIRFAVTNAARHGGEYSLNDLLAADHLAKDALQRGPAMTKEFIDRSAKAILRKHRVKKGGHE
jgi:hypothetical protein